MKLFINPALLAKVQESNNPLLNVPDDAKTGRGNTMRWGEMLSITGVNFTEVDKGRTAIEAKFRVSLASPNASNRGKNTRAWMLINLSAPESSGDFQMTMISLGNIHSLIRAALPEYELDEGLDLETLFGEGSPLLNKDVMAQVTDKPDRDDPSIRRQEINRFTNPEN